jgi:hypothetical protein
VWLGEGYYWCLKMQGENVCISNTTANLFKVFQSRSEILLQEITLRRDLSLRRIRFGANHLSQSSVFVDLATGAFAVPAQRCASTFCALNFANLGSSSLHTLVAEFTLRAGPCFRTSPL